MIPISIAIARWMRSERAAVLYADERVDKDGKLLYVDSTLSMSALIGTGTDFASGRHIDLFSEGDPHGPS